MPTLQYRYVDPARRAAAVRQATPRPVGWREWWNGSPYADPIAGIIGRWTDRATASSNDGGDLLDIRVSRYGFEAQLPDGKVAPYPFDEVRGIVFTLGWDAGEFDGKSRSRLTFNHHGEPRSFDILFQREPLLETIQLLLDLRIPHMEYLNQTRSFRLRTGMMYKDIEEAKKKYGIIW